MSNKKVAEIVTENISKLIEESGALPWRRPWTVAYPLRSNGVPYRGSNIFWLMLTAMAKGYKSNIWYTFKQAQAIGGMVRKGEKASMVTYWKRLDFQSQDDAATDEKDTRKAFVLRYYSVFNRDQIDGLPELPEAPAILPNEDAESVVRAYLDRESIGMTHGGNVASYSPRLDAISMPNRDSFLSVEGYYSTLFHEMAHSTGHEKRLARFKSSDPIVFGGADYSREELVAELAAAMLCYETGIAPNMENSAGYVKGWLKAFKDDPMMLIWSGARADKARGFIIGDNGDAADADEE